MTRRPPAGRYPVSEPALYQFEGVIMANLPRLASADSRERRCAAECVRAAARDYADLRRTETLAGDVRAAAAHALRLADAAPDAPSPELAAFRRYALGEAVAASQAVRSDEQETRVG